VILSIVGQLVIDGFVSLLNVNDHTNGDEQKCASNDQNDNERFNFLLSVRDKGLGLGLNGIGRLLNNL
jgi:hypothetical protein